MLVETAKEGEYYENEGMLYQRGNVVGEETEAVEQLVLPRCCQQLVLELAHAIPLAGHLDQAKMRKQLLQRFFWPNMWRDIATFCRECPQCQRTSSLKVCLVPLIPLPVMDVPFQHIGMDIVGPLTKSRSGNHFVLVICEYATRYSEAIPLKTIDAEQVAEALIIFFSMFGIPNEILTDHGTNFMAKLMKEVYRLLGVKPIRTNPYHPQTDGLVERFDQILKLMLRRTVMEGKKWDCLLPYLLFAYREVPQVSTGFSPFELLYGRKVRGPLDVIKDAWEVDEGSSESVVSYLIAMREKLEGMIDLVRKNEERAKEKEKEWYDRHSR